MKLKSAFDRKFRKTQATLVAMVLTLLFSTGCAAASSDQFSLTVPTCRGYSGLPPQVRAYYVQGLAGGYGATAVILAQIYHKSKNDPKTANIAEAIKFVNTGLDKVIGPALKLTVGAMMQMLDAECDQDPDADAALAFVAVLNRMQ